MRSTFRPTTPRSCVTHSLCTSRMPADRRDRVPDRWAGGGHIAPTVNKPPLSVTGLARMVTASARRAASPPTSWRPTTTTTDRPYRPDRPALTFPRCDALLSVEGVRAGHGVTRARLPRGPSARPGGHCPLWPGDARTEATVTVQTGLARLAGGTAG